MTIKGHRSMLGDNRSSTLTEGNVTVLQSVSPDKDAQKPVVLAAWAVLLRDYYAPHAPTFTHIMDPKREFVEKEIEIYPGEIRCQQLSIQFEAEATTEELIKKTFRAIQDEHWTGLTACKDTKTAVMFQKEQIKRSAQLVTLLEV